MILLIADTSLQHTPIEDEVRNERGVLTCELRQRSYDVDAFWRAEEAKILRHDIWSQLVLRYRLFLFNRPAVAYRSRHSLWSGSGQVIIRPLSRCLRASPASCCE